jgi:ATP-dependent RNA helicase RhlE
VVNFELPNVAEDYVHRIGRTGRAGHEGEAMSLVCVDELKLLKDIERLLKRDITKDVIDGYAPDPSIKAEPIKNGRGGQQQGARNNPNKPGRKKPAGKQSAGKSASPWNGQKSSGNGRSNKPGQTRNRSRRGSRTAA